MVTRYTDPSWTPLFSLISAVVLEEGGILSHAAVVARECGIPAITRAASARKILSGAKEIHVNGTTIHFSVPTK